MTPAPLPWRIEYEGNRLPGKHQEPAIFVVDANGHRVARVWIRPAHVANAQLIVDAVNARWRALK